jgi:hypothetical protein
MLFQKGTENGSLTPVSRITLTINLSEQLQLLGIIPARGRFNQRRSIVVAVALILAGCTNLTQPRMAAGDHIDKGAPLRVVVTTSPGLSVQTTRRLIAMGVARATRASPVLTDSALPLEDDHRLIIHVERRYPRPVVSVSARLLLGSRQIEARTEEVAAPGANPDVVFEGAIADLVRQMLSRPG